MCFARRRAPRMRTPLTPRRKLARGDLTQHVRLRNRDLFDRAATRGLVHAARDGLDLGQLRQSPHPRARARASRCRCATASLRATPEPPRRRSRRAASASVGADRGDRDDPAAARHEDLSVETRSGVKDHGRRARARAGIAVAPVRGDVRIARRCDDCRRGTSATPAKRRSARDASRRARSRPSAREATNRAVATAPRSRDRRSGS